MFATTSAVSASHARTTLIVSAAFVAAEVAVMPQHAAMGKRMAQKQTLTGKPLLIGFSASYTARRLPVAVLVGDVASCGACI